ncbi:MAG: esterase-like activity of phytase family protein [Terricaulis sp.]
MRYFALALILSGCAPLAAQAPIAEQWRAIAVEATPVEFGAEQAGALRFRGGLELRSSDSAFGGLSGMEVLEDGRLVAVSDNGAWFEAQIVLDETGALVGLSGMRIALMRDENGEAFGSKEEGDSEALAQLQDGRLAVAFEQRQAILLYDMNRDGPFGAATRGPPLAGVRGLPPNVGLEAMATLANGDLLVGAEGGGAGDTPLWRSSPQTGEEIASQVRYRPALGFSLTSLDRLPNGDLIALERFFAPVIGPRARITRFQEGALTGEVIAAEELARIAPPLALDNFEAIAAIDMPDGVTRLYILSDDNFSSRQRTLLLAFDLEGIPE